MKNPFAVYFLLFVRGTYTFFPIDTDRKKKTGSERHKKNIAQIKQ